MNQSTQRISAIAFAARATAILSLSFLAACGGAIGSSPESLRALDHYRAVIAACRQNLCGETNARSCGERFDTIMRGPTTWDQEEQQFGDNSAASQWRTSAQAALLVAVEHSGFRQCVDGQLQEHQAQYRQVADDPERAPEWGWIAETSATDPWPMVDANVCVAAHTISTVEPVQGGAAPPRIVRTIQYDRLSLAWTSVKPDPISGASISQEARDYARGDWGFGPYLQRVFAVSSDPNAIVPTIEVAGVAIDEISNFHNRSLLPWVGSPAFGEVDYGRAFEYPGGPTPETLSLGCYMAQERAFLADRLFRFLTRHRVSQIVYHLYNGRFVEECADGVDQACDAGFRVISALEHANFTEQAEGLRSAISYSREQTRFAAARAERAEQAERAAAEQEVAHRAAGAARARATEARAVTNAACMTQCRQRADAATCARVCANAH